MNRKLISKAFSNIDNAYIAESLTAPEEAAHRAPERTAKMGKYENSSGGSHSRKLFALILAACLVFSLALTAYAANWFGIREMFRTYNRELPEEVEPYIQQHTETAAAEDWSAELTESLCDGSRIMTTVKISGGDRYILAPTDCMATDTIGFIGMQGDQTLEEYAQSQGKELLFVGASLMRNERLGIFTESQRFEGINGCEASILVDSTRSGSESAAGDAVCRVYARTQTGEKKNLELNFTLSETPKTDGGTFVPVDPDAIPGMTVGAATVTQSPLGISVRWQETITDQEAFYEIMKVDFDEITYSEGGGTVQEDGGGLEEGVNVNFQISMGKGEITDTLTAHFYDWDKQPIGTIVFKKQ